MKIEQKEVLQKTEEKVVMALDLVEEGQGLSKEEQKQDRRALPEGITSKLLYKDIFRIAWPSLVELTLTQLTSMVDMMMVGQLGAWAIASVGFTMQPKFLMMTMFMAMNVGATALVARYKGAGEQEKANRIMRQALLLSFVLSIIASIVGYIFSEPMIRFMGANEPETIAGGTIYLQIQMMGFVFMALTSTITAVLRGVGNSRIAMIYNLVANVVNVVLNYTLIYGHFGFPRMGLTGASLATIIGQFVAFILAVYVIMDGKQYLHLRLRDGFKPHFESLKSIFNIGIPAMIEQLVMRTGMIIYARTVASLGTVVMATHQVAMNIQAMSFMSGQAFAVSATSLVGQSLGKIRSDMARFYADHTRRLGAIIAFVLAFAFFFFGREIVSLYSNDPAVISQGAEILKLVALVQPFQSAQFILAGALRGAGDTRATAIITLLTVLIVRPGLALYFVNVANLGLKGAWYALVIDQLLRSFLVSLRYRSGKWQEIRV